MQSIFTIEDLLRPDEIQSRPVMERLKELDGDPSARSDVTLPTLAEGEQFRFHIDMSSCIGCRCCEVACNEQNNNPAHVTWRRVGEIEAGSYPDVKRMHLSMSCNHCIEPSCLEGCPTSAYTKKENGIVVHNAEACIGCQYCTWNCPYGVPQYHPERHIVTKCHMCVDRIEANQQPACVEACPVNAIQIEKVNIEEWKQAIDSANAPGVPPADITLSTTRITVPDNFPEIEETQDVALLEPEAAHWSLIIFLLLGQWSVGLFGLVAAGEALGLEVLNTALTSILALMGFAIGQAGMVAATFHLGRPAYAWKAIRAWRRSWLSREVIAFGAYAVASSVPALLAGLSLLGYLEHLPGWAFGAASFVAFTVGLVGIASSAGIYLIPARPAWNRWSTPAQFYLSGFLLAAATGFVSVMLSGGAGTNWAWIIVLPVSLFAATQAVIPWLLSVESMREPAVRQTAHMLTHQFGQLSFMRTAYMGLAAVIAPAAIFVKPNSASIAMTLAMLVFVVLAELIGRYLFFVTVVPRNMAGSFFTSKPSH